MTVQIQKQFGIVQKKFTSKVMSLLNRLLNHDVRDWASRHKNHMHEMSFCALYPFWQERKRRARARSDSHVK